MQLVLNVLPITAVQTNPYEHKMYIQLFCLGQGKLQIFMES